MRYTSAVDLDERFDLLGTLADLRCARVVLLGERLDLRRIRRDFVVTLSDLRAVPVDVRFLTGDFFVTALRVTLLRNVCMPAADVQAHSDFLSDFGAAR